MQNNRPGLNNALTWLWQMMSMYSNEEIRIPESFHEQVREIKLVLKSDISGLVNSVLDFSMNSATVDYIIETANSELNDIIDYWLKNINISLLGRVPIGVKSLSKEYYRERWKNSSLIVLRSTWEDVEISGSKFYLPTKMWFVDGANIKVENGDKEKRIIGTEKYLLKITEKILKPLPMEKNEKIFIQKPFNSWTDLYSVPYLIQKGLYKNLKIYDLINRKGEQITGKALEYLLLLKKGSENLATNPDFTYSTDELKEIKKNFKQMVQESKSDKGTPTYVTNFDTTLEHLIPEYTRILNASLYENIEKRLLAGLGLIDIVEGTSSSRRESLLNPKPFIAETENGIKDFISLLSDIITTIKQENLTRHRKYMNEEIELHYPPVKQFITDNLRDHFRSMYDRGLISKQTVTQVIGDIDLDIEVKRRKTETEEDYDTLLYPPITQNLEGKGFDTKDIKNTEKIPTDKIGPEKKNYKASEELPEPYSRTDTEFLEALAEFSKIYEEAPYKTNKDLPPAVKKYPSGAQTAFRKAFNSALSKYKDEQIAFKIAWSVLKAWEKNNK